MDGSASLLLFAKVGVGLLMLVLMRSLLGVLDLDRAGATLFEARGFVLGALAASVCLALALAALQLRRPGVSLGVSLGAGAGFLLHQLVAGA